MRHWLDTTTERFLAARSPRRAGISPAASLLLPLPKGEGRNEGEARAKRRGIGVSGLWISRILSLIRISDFGSQLQECQRESAKGQKTQIFWCLFVPFRGNSGVLKSAFGVRIY